MPEGVVHWFDVEHGDAEVLRDGQAYRVPPGAIEAAARHPGARVHFDLRRVEGVEQATDVHLRQSARASRHRHRFGTLSGAQHFDTKGRSSLAELHPELHLAENHPLQVARSWATAVARGDVDAALALYSPSATVRVGARSLAGAEAIRRWIETGPALGCRRHARIHGRDGGAVVTWEAETPAVSGISVGCRIAHGEIAEQWEIVRPEIALAAAEGEGGPSGVEVEGALPVAIFTAGRVPASARSRAQQVVARIAAMIAEPVLFARVKLAFEPDPSRPRPARAEVLLDLNGEPLRVHATARTMPEAVDALDRRLRDRLEHRARRRDELHRSAGLASPGEWRHGDLAPERPPYFDRPVEDRQLVRHKTFAVGELSCDEAIFDMEQLDYDFYLFVDLATRTDSVVERTDGGTYRMTRLRPMPAALGATALPVELAADEAPVLGLDEAMARLGASGERHLFFGDEASGRGCVLYLRYDGNYGLVIPE